MGDRKADKEVIEKLVARLNKIEEEMERLTAQEDDAVSEKKGEAAELTPE